MAKIGIEWVKKYHGRASNLSNTKKQAEGFYNKLSGTRSFNWGDDLAWDQDFEESGVGSPATGTDTTWIDSVHIAFFSGHGGPTGPLFGVAGYDNGRAHHSEVRWGNQTLDWIAFDACKILRHEGLSKYFLTGKLQASICGDDKFTGKGYFFSGDYYIRYDWNNDNVDIGYPKRIKDHWHNWPSSFNGGIDAALCGDGPFSGKAYFFKGNSYIRYDWGSDAVDPGYPKNIASHWHGWPNSFNGGIDAVLLGDGPFSGKAYFFKGDLYLRYDWSNDSVDSGYPKKIRDHWHNWPNLNDDVFDRWRDSFNGLHIILGFYTTCNDESKRGRYFAEYLNDGYTVIEAWKKACKETESSDAKWAYLRSGGGSGVNTYNDHWHGKGWVSPDPTNAWCAYSKGSC